MKSKKWLIKKPKVVFLGQNQSRLGQMGRAKAA
jgi:hypothetical protein